MATEQELQAQIDAIMATITTLQEQLEGTHSFNSSYFQYYQEENDRMERYLTEFSTREGILLTIAGLFTLLPLTSPEKIEYFLVWSTPLLFSAIACYILSSKRIHFISKNEVRNSSPIKVNEILKKKYYESLFFHRLTDILIVAFFTSFAVNYYVITFMADITILSSVLILIVALTVGVLRFISIGFSHKEIVPHEATGAGPEGSFEYSDNDEG